MFVEEAHRHKALGSFLLNKVEAEAKAMGARLAHLDTFDFQAKDFYLKHGYEVYGALEDCPPGHKRYHFKKVLWLLKLFFMPVYEKFMETDIVFQQIFSFKERLHGPLPCLAQCRI